MCWTGNKTDHKIAVKDIKVIKVVYVRADKKDNKCYAPLTGYEYTLNKLYETKPLVVTVGHSRKSIIERGFHSFSMGVDILFEENHVRLYNDLHDLYMVCGYKFFDDIENIYPITKIKGVHEKVAGKFKLKLLECIMPEGTEYYENEDGEIVSNKLIITDKETIV